MPRLSDVPAGFEIPSFQRTITREMAITHASPMKNFHTVLEDAQAMGYPDIVVAGPMFTCFFSEMLTRFFGVEWVTSGDLQFKLIKPVVAGETITARAVVTEHVSTDSGFRVGLDVWCERQHDTARTSAGKASVGLEE